MSVKLHEKYDSYQDFIGELDAMLDELYPYIVEVHPKLTTNLKQLQKGAHSIAIWAVDYDHGTLQANGYWSALRIGLNLARLVESKYQHLRGTKDISGIEIDHTLLLLTDYFAVALDVLQRLRDDSVANGLELQASSVSYFTELFTVLLTLDESLVASMYGKYCGFWLCPGSRNIMITCVTAFSVLSDGFSSIFKCIFNSEYRGKVLAKLIKSADISFLKKLGFLMELPVYTSLLPYLLYGNSPQVRRQLRIERQNEWYLSICNKKVSRSVDHRHHVYRKSKYVRCKLIRAQGPHRQSLVFHCHGGGFVMGSPESNEVYLRDWANRLQGVPILSVDYTVSPQAKFPTALQEILDVYLWLTSRRHQVKETLGFHPKHIVLVGDSAGGNLITALCMVLNDIRNHKHHRLHVLMPKSVICVYTPFNLTLKLSPSMILASCDGFISAGVMLSCFEAYLPEVSQCTENTCSDYGLLGKLSFFAFEDYRFQVYETVKRVLEFLKGFAEFGKLRKSWYLEEKSVLKPKVERLYEITSNPYISPLYYDDFESLSNIDLHLIALHFDPFLDDNISMARNWKGNVTVDVLDGLQHGFLNIMPFVKEAKDGCDLCFQRIVESLPDN
ncbi:hormone-sensitive lipase-like isoform X2 [Leptotrombidium deliense]|uniref:Hormone-sensitive lipase-like isoform X2 n=1 Tax=Leptotrombidium deliense TaxID=299467 RepID=A0A443SFQ4_9ACAR|nr:hormone-sensitive lipase-like isoform X2 [Leptotrombidium deliense]